MAKDIALLTIGALIVAAIALAFLIAFAWALTG